jgi:hypothetical protein
MGPLGDPPPVGPHSPHHETLPRALEPLERVGLDSDVWSELAPVLDAILSGVREPGAVGDLSAELVGGVAHAARAAGVRPYAASMQAALDYALTSTERAPARIGVTPGTPGSDAGIPGQAPILQGQAPISQGGDVELWCIRDGRRASVWRIRAGARVMALNVARDDVAAPELVAIGHELRALHERDPLGVVEVLDVTPELLACTWVDGRELHVVDRGDGRGLFIAVEESLRAGTRRPLMLTGKDVPASDTIWASWLEALVRQTSLEEDGRLARPRVDACDGDLVLLNQQPVLVSLSPGPIVRDRKGWERDLLDLRCGARTGALRWGDRAGARTALTRALVAHGDPVDQPVRRG